MERLTYIRVSNTDGVALVLAGSAFEIISSFGRQKQTLQQTLQTQQNTANAVLTYMLSELKANFAATIRGLMYFMYYLQESVFYVSTTKRISCRRFLSAM